MPHKKNPDVFELIRAKCNRIQALPNELTLLVNNLPSGYHRDMQLTKEILFPAITALKDCLHMMHFMLQHILVNPDILADEKYMSLFSVEEVNREVLKGLPFREAYQKIAMQVENNTFNPGRQIHHTHLGSMGNLCNDKIVERFEELASKILTKETKA
jgi:argininosuccinate lyase